MIILNSLLQEGFAILIVGIVIVFISLIILFLVYNFIVPAVLNYSNSRRKAWLEQAKSRENARAQAQYDSGEEMAAVSAAVYIFMEETHDEENVILTINKTVKNYSPWSSKIYTTHNLPNRG